MIQDGWGYGKSEYWSYKAKQIALNNGETCIHLFEHKVKVNIVHIYDPLHFNLGLRVTCPFCDEKFRKTEEKLRFLFLQFYGK